MALISVQFKAEIPDEIAEKCEWKDIQEWLEFSLRVRCSLTVNPVSYKDLEAVEGSVYWTLDKGPKEY